MKKMMYRVDNVVSECLKSLLLYLRCHSVNTEKVNITLTEIDCYLTYKDADVQQEVLDLFKQNNISTDNIKPVYVVKDPNIDKLFGINLIPNKIEIRKEKKSYITVQDMGTHILTKRYHLDELRHEVEYDLMTNHILKDTQYRFGKLKPFIVERTNIDEFNMKYDYSFDGMKNSEYNSYIFNIKGQLRTSIIKRIEGKDAYSVQTVLKEYSTEEDAWNDIPKFNLQKFKTFHIANYFGR